MNKSVLYILLLLITFVKGQEQFRSLSNENWFFLQAGKTEKYKAKIPGTIHTDLLENKLIEDPFLEDNETKLQWIEKEEWIYECNFNLTENELKNQSIQLQFEGLDTYASVYLNQALILEANNMFRCWYVDAKKYLHHGSNNLKIIFKSSSIKGKELASKLTYTLPENERVFVRKAQYHFGWDWGPRFVTAGVWKNVSLHFSNHAYIEKCYIQQKTINKTEASLNFVTKIISNENTDYLIKIGNIKKKINLKKGINSIEIPYNLKKPKLWWCNGLGEPYLYNFTIELFKEQTLLSSKKLSIGLRTVEWIQEKDLPEGKAGQKGRSFYLKLNGVPVFVKGANYIPPHSFLPEVTPEKYNHLIMQAKKANMNMLRVWGGSVYADDVFYNECDKNGILVWQDFMFACGMYPGDSDFLNNIKEEVKDNITRLQNHPSIVIWCGNNENDEGWHNWGWQKQFNYSKEIENKIWKDYQTLFDTIIPNALKETLGENKYFYWPSSPSKGWGRKESLTQGDAHYWGVWWGKEPFDIYKEKTGRFMSEYGFQGMPAVSNFRKFTKELSWDNKSIKTHQKHPIGFETIQEYMARDFKIPLHFEDYVYVSQLLQAYGMKIAIESHRRAMPYCMGTLYWQFNDCWPVTSWSSIDHYNQWKALHYQVKKSYAKQLISIDERNNNLNIYGINDELKKIEGNLKIELIDFYGNVIWQKEQSAHFDANSSRILDSIKLEAIHTLDRNNSFIRISFKNKLLDLSCIHYLARTKDLNLAEPKVNITYLNNNKIQLSSNMLVKNLYLESEGVFFEENFFDLLPHETKIISASNKIETLKWKCLNELETK